MSRWGLRYKGLEPLTPSEWNALVDALDELHSRAPKNLMATMVTFSGDGTTREFKFEHGLGSKPTCVICGKGAPSLPDIDYWTADETYITIAFKEPPPRGSDNVKVWVLAMIQ